MKKPKALDILLWCLKIILPILILIPLAFFTYRLIEGHIEDLANVGTEGYHSGMGLYVFASHVVLFAANAVLTIIGARSRRCRRCYHLRADEACCGSC